MKRLFLLLTISLMTNAMKAAEPDTIGYNKFRFGGYGEIVANFKDYGINRFYGHKEGNAKQNHNTISIPRFVLAFDYKFTPKWILSAEIEFEYGGTGTSYELENTENGEYETEVEKGGEVITFEKTLLTLSHPVVTIETVGIQASHDHRFIIEGAVALAKLTQELDTRLMPGTGDYRHLSLRTRRSEEINGFMMFIRQSDRYDEMTNSDVKRRNDQTCDMKLLQGNFTTLLNLRLIFAVLCIL